MPIIKEVAKLWGRELWHHNDRQGGDGYERDDRGYCMKTLELRAGAQSSLHYHKVKRETFLVVAGEVALQVGTGDNERDLVLRPGDSFTIAPYVAHSFTSISDEATVIEASTPHDDADVYRLKESRLLP